MQKLSTETALKLTIKRDYILESFFTFYLLIMGLLSGYFGRNAIWLGGLLIFFSLLWIKKPKYRRELWYSLSKNAPFYATAFLGCASIVTGTSNQYLSYNLKWWLEVLLILFGIIILDSNPKCDFRSVIKSYFYFLNFFWIINLIIVSIQCTGNGFMIKQEWLANNSFYEDHCSGLFGAGGTHKLSIFAVFMLVYNLDYIKEISSKRRRKGMYIYVLVTEMWMLYISTLNDNKTLFALLPIWGLVYYIIQATNETVMKNFYKFVRLLPIILLLVITVIVVIRTVPTLASFIQDYVIESGLKLATLGRSGSRGSIERITIATDAMEAGYGLLLGKGLGAAAVSERISANYLGYRHFSMSSIGTLTTLGGVWFYLSVCSFYARTFYRFMKFSKKSMARWMLCLLMIMGLTIYTPIFEAPISMLWTSLTFAIVGRKDAAPST